MPNHDNDELPVALAAALCNRDLPHPAEQLAVESTLSWMSATQPSFVYRESMAVLPTDQFAWSASRSPTAPATSGPTGAR